MRPSTLLPLVWLGTLASLAACGGATGAPSSGASPGPEPGPGSSTCTARSGTVAAFPDGAVNAAFVDGSLYFDTKNLGRIERVPLAGGAIDTMLDAGGGGEWGIGGGTFAWETEPVTATAQSSTYVDQLHIRDAAGTVHDLPSMTNGSATQVHVDAQGNVYWLAPSSPAGVVRWNHATGEQELVPTGAIQGAYVVAESSLYWIDADNRTIRAIPTSGGTPRALATPGSGDLSLVAGDVGEPGVLYVRETPPTGGGAPLGGPQAARVHAVSKSDGATSVVLDGVTPMSNLAADDTHLYWVTVPPGTGDYIPGFDLVRRAKGGGAVEKIASFKNLAGEGTIGLDACNVYVVMGDGLVSYPKP
jgi:hypothetical protein